MDKTARTRWTEKRSSRNCNAVGSGVEPRATAGQLQFGLEEAEQVEAAGHTERKARVTRRQTHRGALRPVHRGLRRWSTCICRSCEGVVMQASAPAQLIEGGFPTEATVAQVPVSK